MIPAAQPNTTAPNSAAQNAVTQSDRPCPASDYRTNLHFWCIIRLLPNLQRVVVARFRKRNDAEEHLRIRRRLEPDAEFIIVFEPPSDRASSST